MIVKLHTEHHLEFLSLKWGCRGSSESTLVKMPHCWKSHGTAHLWKLGLIWIINAMWMNLWTWPLRNALHMQAKYGKRCYSRLLFCCSYVVISVIILLLLLPCYCFWCYLVIVVALPMICCYCYCHVITVVVMLLLLELCWYCCWFTAEMLWLILSCYYCSGYVVVIVLWLVLLL